MGERASLKTEEMSKKIEEIEFTIFDTETTGLEPESGDRIVEIAAIKFIGKERRGAFQSLVNPGQPISPEAFNINQITPDMLKDAPPMQAVIADFLEFIQDTCLCTYNAGFDLGFLNHELKLTGQSVLKNALIVDILKMSKRLLPGLQRYALWFVADKLGIKKEQAHRALSDVELTLDVFNRLMQILSAKKIFDFDNFLSLFAFNVGLLEDIHNQKVARIQQALDLGVKLKIKYLSSSSAEVSEREVLPKEVRQDKGRSYLVGYCYLRNEERSFRIDSILHLEYSTA